MAYAQEVSFAQSDLIKQSSRLTGNIAVLDINDRKKVCWGEATQFLKKNKLLEQCEANAAHANRLSHSQSDNNKRPTIE